MYVEDLVERLVGYGKFLFEPNIIPSVGWEYNFATSVANQISNGSSLTEKQATMAVRILKKYKKELEAYFGKSIDLDNPVYRNPFRSLIEEKTIKIETHNGVKKIAVRFPYNAELIKNLQEYVSNADWKSIRWNTTLKQYVAGWDHEVRAWLFTLKEENIIWVSNNLLSKGFTADEEFNEYLANILTVVDNVYDYAPCLIKEEGQFKYKNVSSRVPAPEGTNLIDILFKAKNVGVTAWSDEVDAELKSLYVSQVTSAFLNTKKALFVNSTSHDISVFKDILKYAGPVLIIIPGGSEVEHTMKWHKLAQDCLIDNADMSVMFRMPNESHGKFNQYIKDNQLNNEIHDNTKVVFVSTKIPKPLVKSGIKFKTVINLGYYRDLHFSMSVVLNSTTNVCYYNNKQPHGVNVVDG